MARYLFVPMAEAVVFAMLTSYVLSRTLVPTLAKYWLRTRGAGAGRAGESELRCSASSGGFEARFEALRDRYQAMLTTVLEHRGVVHRRSSWRAAVASMLLYPVPGQ